MDRRTAVASNCLGEVPRTAVFGSNSASTSILSAGCGLSKFAVTWRHEGLGLVGGFVRYSLLISSLGS